MIAGEQFTSEDSGVYSCLMPDENGTERSVNIGLYHSGYNMNCELMRQYNICCYMHCYQMYIYTCIILYVTGSAKILNNVLHLYFEHEHMQVYGHHNIGSINGCQCVTKCCSSLMVQL